MSAQEQLPPTRGERITARRERIGLIFDRLEAAFPHSKTALTHRNPFELLIATILSAQCTDERVNMVTPSLFKRFPTPAKLGAGSQEDVEALIQSTGFFRQKAKNIRATGAKLDTEFGGTVPSTIAELTSLPGVARKTANVLISNCYPEQAAGIAVDTHVQRIARRLGMTRRFSPIHVEQDLMKVIPRERWNDVTHLLIEHGRATCTARRPSCASCVLRDLCPSAERFLAGAR